MYIAELQKEKCFSRHWLLCLILLFTISEPHAPATLPVPSPLVCFCVISDLVRGCAIITRTGEEGGPGKWGKHAPKLSHTSPLIKQKLISPPWHNDNIKANHCSLIPSLSSAKSPQSRKKKESSAKAKRRKIRATEARKNRACFIFLS